MTVLYKHTDKATNHLLDFIAGGVPTNQYGESGGCYNATFGDLDGSTYGDLSAKSLSAIYEMMTKMVNANGVSSATGRYQALKATLQEYQTRKKLPNSTRFTEELQDDFGLCKMVDRGYSKWWDSDIDDDEFMHRLSMEWASLPDPYNEGKSHYDGDAAGNHASTSLDHFRYALITARAYIGGAPPSQVDGEPLVSADEGVRSIQSVLVATGDLRGDNAVDGVWGRRSEAALRTLLKRDK